MVYSTIIFLPHLFLAKSTNHNKTGTPKQILIWLQHIVHILQTYSNVLNRIENFTKNCRKLQRWIADEVAWSWCIEKRDMSHVSTDESFIHAREDAPQEVLHGPHGLNNHVRLHPHSYFLPHYSTLVNWSPFYHTIPTCFLTTFLPVPVPH